MLRIHIQSKRLLPIKEQAERQDKSVKQKTALQVININEQCHNTCTTQLTHL